VGRDVFQDRVRLISGWIVALLALLAAWFVFRTDGITPGMRATWYVLVGLAVVRAVYRTWLVTRRRSLPPETGDQDPGVAP
jgi:hypothetical protein